MLAVSEGAKQEAGARGGDTPRPSHPTPSLSTGGGDWPEGLHLRHPCPGGPGTYLPLRLGSEPVLQQAQRLWGQDALEVRVSRYEGNLHGKGKKASLWLPHPS